VLNQAENIPFEPDLGNTSGGMRAYRYILWGIFSGEGVCPIRFLKVKLSGVST